MKAKADYNRCCSGDVPQGHSEQAKKSGEAAGEGEGCPKTVVAAELYRTGTARKEKAAKIEADKNSCCQQRCAARAQLKHCSESESRQT